MPIVGKPQDPGPDGYSGDAGVDPVAVLVLLLVCLLLVAPWAVNAWRKGDRGTAAGIVAIPVVGVALWVVAVALTN